MIKNYFKLGLRSLAKNRLSSLINILGLALAVGCSMVVFEFFGWSMHLDSFHPKINNLFVVERISEQNGNQQLWGDSPAPMAQMLKSDFPQIKNTARVNYTDVIIKQGDNVFRESVTFVDNSFYSMFDFPVKWGNTQHFTDQDGIVLTSELSEKLFGHENPTGKNINILFNKDGIQTPVNFTIKGVFAKRPYETSFYFSALIPYSKFAALGMDKTGNWSQSVSVTFIEANNAAALSTVYKQSKKYVQLYNRANPDNKITGFNFQPLNAMNFHAYKVSNQIFASTHIAAYIMLIVIGISILLLVYFNYMNIAIAAASTRLKEISVRKVMGSSRKQIIYQFILENIILCTIAVLLGVVLAKILFLPMFSKLANVPLGKDLFTNYLTWLELSALVIVSALSGAAYPAFYISAFKAVSIMKGNSKMGSNNRFRKSLLGFQFFLTFLAISIAIAFIMETKKIKARPWGYDPAKNVVVSIDESASYEAFRDELKSNNDVRSVTGSAQPLGSYSKQMVVKTEGKEQTVQGISVLPGFATQLGISIVKGRDLNGQFKTDQTDAVLVNQAFVKQMHWTSAIGKNIEYENHKYQVVGEVNDFHYETFETPVGPLIMLGCKPADVNFVYVKTTPGLFTSAHTGIEKTWKKVNPDLPFKYYYQESVFDNYYDNFIQVSEVMGVSSIIMIIISVSGIFGLALLILGKKMKEISVRKVLGAGMGTIVYLINKEFLFAVGFSLLLGVPISLYLTQNLFHLIAPESSVSFVPLVISFIVLIIMTAISVSWHIFKAHTSNPTRYLKEE